MLSGWERQSGQRGMHCNGDSVTAPDMEILDILEDGYGINLLPLASFCHGDLCQRSLRVHLRLKGGNHGHNRTRGGLKPSEDAQGHLHHSVQAGGAADPQTSENSAWTPAVCSTGSDPGRRERYCVSDGKGVSACWIPNFPTDRPQTSLRADT